MALTTRLEFRQSQALVMTPQLMQAIKLLQLSNLDLMAYVEEELEKNPLLERVSDDDGPTALAGGCWTTSRYRRARERQEWMGEDLATSRNAHRRRASEPAWTTSFPRMASLRHQFGADRRRDRGAFGMGERRIRRPRGRRIQS